MLVSKSNPFSRYAGPVYFERLESSRPPDQFWQQMQTVFVRSDHITAGGPLDPMNSNYSESRDHHQQSFKVLGVPQIPLAAPRFHGAGRIRGANFKIYLWANGRGGSFMELWVMDKF